MAIPLPKSHQEKIANSKVLVVGAGGIGCELLKNLALSGFKNIETIDLDTIDVSNLNRQFLFQKIHVGKPKALVASQAVQKLAGPSLNIEPHHCSIFEPEYNKSYFEQFDIVLNALDNLSARRHVNRICMSANLPLIESGSAGYLGQSYPIIKSTTECFDCRPKPKRKTYPACTIRNTPSEPVHCIVWAKFLYSQLFGEYDADNEVSPEAQLLDEEDKNETKEDPSVEATKTLEPAKVSTRDFAENCGYNPEKLFKKFYNEDVKTLLSMDSLWTKRTPPNAQEWNLSEETENLKSRDIPNLEQLCHLFSDSLNKIKEEYNLGSKQPLSWDKDDVNALHFVVAAANLRALVFNINLKSQWDVKSIAGNIIPAIASTNAMVAGLIVLQAIAKLTRDDFNRRHGYRTALVQNIGNKRIMASMADKPTEGCFSCMDKATATICVDFEKTSLKEFKDGLIGQELSLQQPDVRVGESCVLIDGDDDEPDPTFLAKKLSDFSQVQNGCIMTIEDFLQDIEIEVTLINKTSEHDFEGNYKILSKSDMDKAEKKNTLVPNRSIMVKMNNVTIDSQTPTQKSDDLTVEITEDIPTQGSQLTDVSTPNSIKDVEVTKVDSYESPKQPEAKKCRVTAD